MAFGRVSEIAWDATAYLIIAEGNHCQRHYLIAMIRRIIQTEFPSMTREEYLKTWKGGLFDPPLSQEEAEAVATWTLPSRKRNIPQSVRNSMARGLRALRRERFEATPGNSEKGPE